MKQCPLCKNTYTDDSLQFCLEDGETLYYFTNEQPTQEFSNINNQPTQAFPQKTTPIHIPIGNDSSPQTLISSSSIPSNEPVGKPSSGSKLIIGLIVGFILLAMLGVIAIAGYFVWITQPSNPPQNTTPVLDNSQVKLPTADEIKDLEEKIANLEKELQDQKKKTPTVPIITNSNISNPTPQPNRVTAKANSPNDGFLALRSEPNTQTGERILKIPHGVTITVWGCLKQQLGSKGRWCQVDYNGTKGWANDGYMIYD